IGLMIKAGAILISYGVSIWNPEGAKNLYMGQNLYNLRQYNFFHYTLMVSFMVALLVLEAYIAYLVIRVLSRIKLANPFTFEVSGLIQKISYFIFGTWIMGMLYNAHTIWLLKRIAGFQENMISGEFIFLAGVVFVFSQIFKKGVELQSENELTV
ncbi:MAG TPA: DUF2975 domain-containing protein, partial [Flavisolibacter sp.]|nr:DUF2975 domain-containing protein [Flavisolibacter sp.]